MDGDWDLKSWNPSVNSILSPVWQTPTPREIQGYRQELQDQTRCIAAHPYDATRWRRRAKALIALGFPELAASDAYKAILLYSNVIDKKEKMVENAWAKTGVMGRCKRVGEHPPKDLTHDEAYQRKHYSPDTISEERLITYRILVEALILLLACYDLIEVCTEALTYYPTDNFISSTKKEVETWYRLKREKEPEKHISIVEDAGRLLSVTYPWIPDSIRDRSDDLILQANRQLTACSYGILEIKQSSLKEDCLGVFATRDVQYGESILDTRTPLGTKCDQMSGKSCYNCFATLTSISISFPCCRSLQFCSFDCYNIAGHFYHQALCGKDFSHFYVAAITSPYPGMTSDEVPPFCTLTWLRILAICVQGGRHPFANPIFAMLRPQHDLPDPVRWSLQGRVVEPIKILQGLGIDIFSDARYDSWVLEQLWSWKVNNYANNGNGYLTYIDPMTSFFNHSCDPEPMFSQPLGGTSHQILWARRRIQKAEEVFANYILFNGQNASLKYSERQKLLGSWMPDGCRCSRCLKENQNGR